MNPHPVNREDVMAYLDGELPPDAAKGVAEHLTQCRSCQNTAADLQGVSRQMAAWTIEMPVSELLPPSIAEALKEVPQLEVKRHRSRVWGWLFEHRIAAVAVLATPILLVSLVRFTAKSSGARFAEASRTTDERSTEPFFEMRGTAVLPHPLRDQDGEGYAPQPEKTAPLVVHAADLLITTRNFENVRPNLDRILKQYDGHVAQLDLTAPSGGSRKMVANLRIPSLHLEAALGEFRKLGHVDSESQRGEEVTRRVVDLQARLANSRNTEQILREILRTRTGKLGDVLEVETKIAEVRGQIEEAEAEQKSLNNRISLATVSLTITEEFHDALNVQPTTIGGGLRNSAVRGMRSAFDGVIGTFAFLLEIGPSVVLFGLALGLPAYLFRKRFRRKVPASLAPPRN